MATLYDDDIPYDSDIPYDGVNDGGAPPGRRAFRLHPPSRALSPSDGRQAVALAGRAIEVAP